MRPYKPKKKRAYHNLVQLVKEMQEHKYKVVFFDGWRITGKGHYYYLFDGEISVEKIEG